MGRLDNTTLLILCLAMLLIGLWMQSGREDASAKKSATPAQAEQAMLHSNPLLFSQGL